MSDFVRVASRSDLETNSAIAVEVDDEPIALYDVDGEVFATSNTCTHAEASLSQGRLRGHVIECCLHGARFDVRTGEVVRMPAVAPVKTYETQVRGDDILVRLDG